MSPVETAAEAFAAFASISLFANIFSYAVAITLYVLGSLGLYTIAKRRQIKYPWMAWVPLLNLWTLGSISDQYQYVVREKVRSRRKWMIGLSIVAIVVAIVMYVFLFVAYIQLFMNAASNMDIDYMSEMQILEMVLQSFVPTFIVMAVYLVIYIVLMILEYVCYYNLFQSCDPENKGLFLVLGIFFNFLLPIFTFVCRNKDLGMPPRNDQPAAVPNQIPNATMPWSQPIEQAEASAQAQQSAGSWNQAQ